MLMNRVYLRTAVMPALVIALGFAAAKDVTLLNVSYDPKRELFKDYNAAFATYWKAKTGDSVNVKQSQSGSGKESALDDRRTRSRYGHTGAGLRH